VATRLWTLGCVRANGASERRGAPFLHEATHELLASTRRTSATAGDATPVRYPLWLTEGLADYVARVVADQFGIIEEGPFGTPTLSGADAVCAELALTPDGAKRLPFVGADAVPDLLFTTDRARFAPTFCSCSLSGRTHRSRCAHQPVRPHANRLSRPSGRRRGSPAPVVTEWRTRLGLHTGS
jgi:hypothetical protein